MAKLLLLTIFLIFGLIPIAGAQNLGIENSEIEVGETTNVNMTAQDVSDLANFDINITYDPSVVKVTKAENNPAFGGSINNLAYADEGWVRIATLNTGAGQNDDVWLSTLTLIAVGSGESSLDIEVLTFVDSSENDITVKIKKGNFISRSNTTPTTDSTDTATEENSDGGRTGGGSSSLATPSTNTPRKTATLEPTKTSNSQETSDVQSSETPITTSTSQAKEKTSQPEEGLNMTEKSTPGFEVIFAFIGLLIIANRIRRI